MFHKIHVISNILKYMKSSDAKASKCHLKFSSLMMIFIKLVYLSSVLLHLNFFHMDIEIFCSFCKQAEERFVHLFFGCPISKQFLSVTYLVLPFQLKKDMKHDRN